jgi:hypothetical protein
MTEKLAELFQERTNSGRRAYTPQSRRAG